MDKEALTRALKYCPETGDFTWRITNSNRAKKGTVAGSIIKGYVVIGLNHRLYSAHRLAFLYMTGDWPEEHVDHINRVRSDNRWTNLRHSTPLANHSNRINNNSFVGVSWDKASARWRAQSSSKGVRVSIGRFKTHLAACYAKHSFDII